MDHRWFGRVVNTLLAIGVGVFINLATSGWTWPVVTGLIVFALATIVWEVVSARRIHPVANIEAMSATKTPTLPRVWNVPARDAAFEGREDLLAELADGLTSKGTAVVQALFGISGVGKTQLTIEYAHRSGSLYQLVWWIDAEHEQLIPQQLALLATTAKWVPAGADVPAAVAQTGIMLRTTNKWLVIFDNAPGPAEVQRWLPVGPGHVVVTSRNSQWMGSAAAPISVDVFSRSESAALLRRHLPSLADAEADTLARELGDLPLALAQAAGFLSETGVPVDVYLIELRKHAAQVLAMSTLSSHPKSLAAALWMSLGTLEGRYKAAAELVRLCAFFASEPIPVDLFFNAPPGVLSAPLAAEAKSTMHMGLTLKVIGQFGLARVGNGHITFHRLAQAIFRDLLDSSTRAVLREQAEALLIAAGPVTGHAEHWERWKRLMPHLLASNPTQTSNPDLRQLAINACRYLVNSGQARGGYELSLSLFSSWRERIGPEHPHTLMAAFFAATADNARGFHVRARRLAEQTFALYQKAIGECHEETLSAATELAIIMADAGDAAGARKLSEETLARCRESLGEDHRLTVIAMSNLADHLRELGEPALARQLHLDALNRKTTRYGSMHPQTLASADSLAVDLRMLGEIEQAIELHKSTLESYQQTLGPSHPITLQTTGNLADDLTAAGRLEDARYLRETTLAQCQEHLGDDHPTTLRTAQGLSGDLRDLGLAARANQLDLSVAESRKRIAATEDSDSYGMGGRLRDSQLLDALATG